MTDFYYHITAVFLTDFYISATQQSFGVLPLQDLLLFFYYSQVILNRYAMLVLKKKSKF